MEYLRRQKPKCLVIGGAGFLGRHLVGQLLEQGRYSVTVGDLRDPGEPRVKFVKMDIAQEVQVLAACEGMQVVFHVATLAPSVQNSATESAMQAVNVTGTANVVKACSSHGVPKLVYTSTASVVFDGRDLVDVDESIPYACRPYDYYAKTKIEGERIVLAANGQGKLATVALRPSYVYGEYDSLFLPLLVAKAKEGKMKYRIGSGITMPTYAGNAAQAHIQAAEALSTGSKIAGKAYFVTDSHPRVFWDFMGDILEPLGYGRPHIWLPGMLVYILAWILQYIIIPLVRPVYTIQASEFSPARIRIVNSRRILRIDNARRDFGYEPKVSTDEGIKRTVKYFEHLRNKV